jgi:hypothetical protein
LASKHPFGRAPDRTKGNASAWRRPITIVATPDDSADLRISGPDGAVVLRPSGRAKVEALGLLVGMLAVLLGLALTVGATLPIGQ